MKPISTMIPEKRSQANQNALTGLLLAAVLIVAFNTWLAFRSINVLLESEFWVQHTLKVINQVERIMSSAKDAETGNRGFLITGEDEYLQPYTVAVRELPGEIDKFASLTSDNPSQQQRLIELRAVAEQRLTLLARGIEEKRKGASIDEIHLLVLSGTGKVEMDHLRRIADDMEAEENRLLAARVSDAHYASLRARWTIGLASSLDLVLLVLFFRYLARERLLRLEKERVAEELAFSRAEVEANWDMAAITRKLVDGYGEIVAAKRRATAPSTSQYRGPS